jgi:hypothetical protein
MDRTNSGARAARVYVYLAAGLIVLALPLFFARFGTRRAHDVTVRETGRRDGVVPAVARSRPFLATAASVDGGPWLPPGGAAVQRHIRSFPAGTVIAWRERGSASPIIERVTTDRDDPSRLAGRAIRVTFALILLVSAMALAAGGIERRAFLAAAALAGVALILADDLLEPNSSSITDPAIRDLVIGVWLIFPRYLALPLLVQFFAYFPRALSRSEVLRFVIVSMWAAALSVTLLETAIQIPNFYDRMPVARQVALLALPKNVKALLFIVSALAAACVVFAQGVRTRGATPDERRRGRLIGSSAAILLLPMFVLMIVQLVSIRMSGHPALSSTIMSIAFAPLMVLPPALAYAVLARRVDGISLLVRRGIVYSFTTVTLRIVSAIPLLWILAVLFEDRDVSLRSIVAQHSAALPLSLIVALAGIRFAPNIHHAVEQLFMRERQDARRVLRALADNIRTAGGPMELTRTITTDLDRAFHPETVTIFLADARGETLRAPLRGDVPPIDMASDLSTLLIQSHEPLELALASQRIADSDRFWLARDQVRLLIPLFGGSGGLVGIIALGEKRSEMLYDREDMLLLTAAAGSAALAIENHILRSSPGSTRGAAETAVENDEDAARSCTRCNVVYGPPADRCPADGAPLAPAPVPYILAGKYRVDRRLGAGGMGIVYIARDLSLARNVALKTMPKISSETAQRFRREARAFARLSHPNLATIFAEERWRGRPVLVFELLEGGTLADRLDSGPLDVGRVVDCGIMLADALEAAHAIGVLHRDIKPSNIGFTIAGTAKLLDFGLTCILADQRQSADLYDSDLVWTAGDLTASSAIVGTPAYVSPEAVVGRTPDARFDLWSLAVTCYEATTGANPYRQPSRAATLNQIVTVPAADARERRADCPAPLAEFFHEALSLDASRRPQSATEFRERLIAVRNMA